jgi:hypothetical protein
MMVESPELRVQSRGARVERERGDQNWKWSELLTNKIRIEEISSKIFNFHANGLNRRETEATETGRS